MRHLGHKVLVQVRRDEPVNAIKQGMGQTSAQHLPLARPAPRRGALRDGKPGGAVKRGQLGHKVRCRAIRPHAQHRLCAISGVVIEHVGTMHASCQVEAEPFVQERRAVTH
jgi:hypothetical protein